MFGILSETNFVNFIDILRNYDPSNLGSREVEHFSMVSFIMKDQEVLERTFGGF